MKVDYEDLLIKYITHVGETEGVNFLNDKLKPAYITDAEWQQLKEVADDAECFALDLMSESRGTK